MLKKGFFGKVEENQRTRSVDIHRVLGTNVSYIEDTYHHGGVFRWPIFLGDFAKEFFSTLLDEGATDGQMADYFAAECSGDHGAWNLGVVEYFCPKCNLYSQVINDELPSYYPLIEAWHENAAGGDTFSRFVFQYLAFIAHIKNNLFYDAPNDRMAMQRLKREERIRNAYLETVDSNKELNKCWSEVITELESRPLHNSSTDPDYPEIDKWWNSLQDRPNAESNLPEGRVHSLADWPNMVEYWYSVRNNLFHGGKSPNTGRDAFLVEHAFVTLRELVENELLHSRRY